jgi:murein DD-endopeptidase MepM/ murein hydrolase activator NlpD
MQAPSSNRITQTAHGPYNAVDYSYTPDIDFYAPEDGKVVFYQESGSCGNNLQLLGKTGRHGFCHLETAYVKVGDQVKRGQRLGKMGYTGYTEPKGPNGRHLHWVLQLPNGIYAYPPDFINEAFNQKEEDMIDDAGARELLTLSGILAQPGDKPDRQPTLEEIKNLIGKSYPQAMREVRQYQPWKNNLAKIKYYDADIETARKQTINRDTALAYLTNNLK